MFDYNASSSTALRLITQFGQKIPILRLQRSFDPIEGTVQTIDIESGHLDAVTLPASKGTVQAFDNRIPEDLRKTKLRFVIAAAATAPFEPEGNDYIIFENRVWLVKGQTPLNPGGVPVIYKFGAFLTSSGVSEQFLTLLADNDYNTEAFIAAANALEEEVARFGTGNEHDWE